MTAEEYKEKTEFLILIQSVETLIRKQLKNNSVEISTSVLKNHSEFATLIAKITHKDILSFSFSDIEFFNSEFRKLVVKFSNFLIKIVPSSFYLHVVVNISFSFDPSKDPKDYTFNKIFGFC